MHTKETTNNESPEEQRRFYKAKFEQSNWATLPDEIIVQAIRPYPAYWFVSSRGYVLSAYGKEPQKLRPALNWCGPKNKEGKRTRKEYLLGYYTDESGGKEFHCVRLHKIISEHFPRVYVPEGCEEKPSHTHHCKPVSLFAPDQAEEANRADNLRKTVDSTHIQLTRLQNKTLEQKQQSIDEAMEGKPQFYATQETLQQILKNLLADNPSPIVVKEIYADSNPQSKPEFIDIGSDIEFTTKDTDEQQEGGEEQ